MLELSLFTAAVFGSLLLLWAAISAFPGLSIINGWYTPIFIGAVVSLQGVRLIWYRAGGRYAYTHNLGWSFASRDVMFSFALTMSGAAFAIVASMF